MKFLFTLLSLLFLTAAAQAQKIWSDWHDVTRDGEKFRWRWGSEEQTIDQHQWIPPKHKPVEVPGYDAGHLNYQFRSYRYANIENVYSKKVLFITAFIVDDKRNILWQGPRVGLAPNKGTIQQSEVIPGPGVNWHWEIATEWQNYTPVSRPHVKF
jgi:hypothetical protein